MAVVCPVKVINIGTTDGGHRVLEFSKPDGIRSGRVMVHTSAQLGENVWIEEGSPVASHSSVGSRSSIERGCHVWTRCPNWRRLHHRL